MGLLDKVDQPSRDIASALGFADELAELRRILLHWVAHDVSPAMREMMGWQFDQGSKYFRPLTMFACHQAKYGGAIPPVLIERAVVLEMMHNVSLIIDDILDQSPTRRGVPTLYCKFGLLPALMASGYITAECYRLSADRPGDVKLFSELLERLGVAECLQWDWRRQPLGYADWELLAQEDTGSMFEVCAALAVEDGSLRRFGRLLGMVYHGCDDVADVKGLTALGGGGQDDLRDGILTLPASLAIEDAEIRALFCDPQPSDAALARIGSAMRERLPNAEDKLDELAATAKWEAHANSKDPSSLYALVERTRELSRQ